MSYVVPMAFGIGWMLGKMVGCPTRWYHCVCLLIVSSKIFCFVSILGLVSQELKTVCLHYGDEGIYRQSFLGDYVFLIKYRCTLVDGEIHGE